MTHHRGINKIQAYVFMHRLYAYLLALRYVQLLAKYDHNNLTSITDASGATISFAYDTEKIGTATIFGKELGRQAVPKW